jgi:hypothetical protein
MRTAVGAFNDGVSGALELVVQTALDQAAEHRIARLVAMEREARDVRLATGARHSAVHRLDDVAANAEVA